MSVENASLPRTVVAILDGHIENYESCFLCGNPISGPFVYWHGSTGDIALHESCADYLAWNLVKDSATLRMEESRVRHHEPNGGRGRT